MLVLDFNLGRLNYPKVYDEAILLAKEISKEVEENVTYPGDIKINVIRELRAIEYAR